MQQTCAVAADKPLGKGERIVFLGDSITQAGAGPGGYVALVKEAIAKKYPDIDIEVIGAGISGNRVPDLEARLDKDVLTKKPTLVIIYIGINDVWHSANGRGTSKSDYEQGLLRIIKRIQETGSRVVLCTPSVIGEKHDGSNPFDAMLDEYSQISRTVAAQTRVRLLDLRKQFMAHLKAQNKENADKNILTGDTVHLNAAGNRFVADRMLEAIESTGKWLRHVVLFKFKPEVTPAEVQEVVTAFAALKNKIDQLEDFEWGTDVSAENLTAGFTHCFVGTFRDTASRDAYLPHPAHGEFVKLVGPRVEKVLVVDYWANR
ncbi:MAG TPA: GDSL-type esterase/lipase family protein [Planctomycetaceae bacterium]|jgi:lysophospholipase L1-like esterase